MSRTPVFLILAALSLLLVGLGWTALRLLPEAGRERAAAREGLDARLRALEERLGGLESRLEEGPAPASDAVGKRTELLLERVDELASQLYEFERAQQRDLMRLQTNVLRRLSAVAVAGAEPGVPADPVALKEQLAASGVELNLSARWARIKGRVVAPERAIEAVAVMEGGPTHETLFLVDCEGLALRKALVALGCSPGEGADWRAGRAPSGAPLFVYVTWPGLQRPWKLEDLIIDTRSDTAMTEPNWVFVGSRFESDFRTGEEYFMADAARVAISLVHKFSHVAVVSSAHADAGNENIWMPNPRTMPEDPSLEISITLSPVRQEAWEWR